MVTIVMDYESDMRTSKRRSSCFSNCESQIFCSYVICLISSLLIAGGFYLTILKWDHLWLILPFVGSILIFIGACMYYSGQMNLNRRSKSKASTSSSNGRRRRRNNRGSNKDRGHGGDNLISSALGDSRSLSQLSINMIPQYFANSDLSGATGPASMPYSQILRVNGQSFLILPLSGETSSANPSDTAISLQNLMVKIPFKNEQQSNPEGSEIYKKTEDLQKRMACKDNASTEVCFSSSASSSVSRGDHIIGLDRRAVNPSGYVRETDPGASSESYFISNYFCAPGTSSSNPCQQPEAQTSGANNGNSSRAGPSSSSCRSLGSNNQIIPGLIQSSPPTSSTSSMSSSFIGLASSSSSSRRPLLRRDTFNKGKSSVTIVRLSNHSDSVHAQTSLVLDTGTSSAPTTTAPLSPSKNTINPTDSSNLCNSYRLLSSQPGSAGSCNDSYPQSASGALVITQSNLSTNLNIPSSSSTSQSKTSSTIANSRPQPRPGESSLIPRHTHHHPHQHCSTDQFNNSSDETFIAMCGGNACSNGDTDSVPFDENLIETGSATPPPSYEEVLSIDTAGPAGSRNSITFDTL